MRSFPSLEALRAATGEHLGYSQWLPVTQERVNLFADASSDHQWIHVDPRRAAQGPFGTTVAHGYLTLSLIPMLVGEVLRVDGARLAINYGLDRVRFPAPLPTGSSVRAGVRLESVTTIEGGVHVANEVTVEREGGAKPVCVARTLSRYYL